MWDYRTAKRMHEERLRQAEQLRNPRPKRHRSGARFGTGLLKLIVPVAAGLLVAIALAFTLLIL